MTDIPLDDDIPMIIDLKATPNLNPRCRYRPEKFPWVAMFLLAISCTMVGIGAGWTMGYVKGINDSQQIIEGVFDEIRSEQRITEGHMPW
jgi:hypothetical protein